MPHKQLDKSDDPVDATWYEDRDMPQPGEYRDPPGSWLVWTAIASAIVWVGIIVVVIAMLT